MPKPSARRCAAVALACLCRAAAAQEPEDAPGDTRYVLGLSTSFAPEYSGAGRTQLKLRPLWAVQWGRVRISTSRAGSLLGYGADAAGPGASSELIATNRWKFGAGLRVDSGRQAADSDKLQGLPDVRRTLRGRLYANYKVDDHWDLGASLSQDLLNRGGGAFVNLDFGYHDRLGPNTTWSTGAGVTLADATRMRTFYGIEPADAPRAGLPAYRPGGGLQDVHAGIGMTTALTKRWIAFANMGVARLVGDAAASPLTDRTTSVSASAGIAWRCCP